MKPPCIICNSSNVIKWTSASDKEYFTSEETYTYYQCQECVCLYINPVPKNKLSQIYPNNYYSYDKKDSKNFSQRGKEILDTIQFRSLFKKMPKKNKYYVLDVGGGTGWMLDIAIRSTNLSIDSQIVDIDKKAGDVAKLKGHKYFCGTIDEFNSQKKFDLILLLNLIEHVDNPQALLSKLEFLLSPNGIILLKTPNFDSLDAKLFKESYWGGLHCPRHWVLFSRSSLDKLVKNSKLTIEKFDYTQGAPFWSWSFLNFLNERGVINHNKNNPLIYSRLNPIFEIVFSLFDYARKPFFKTSQMFLVLRKDTNKDNKN